MSDCSKKQVLSCLSFLFSNFSCEYDNCYKQAFANLLSVGQVQCVLTLQREYLRPHK